MMMPLKPSTRFEHLIARRACVLSASVLNITFRFQFMYLYEFVCQSVVVMTGRTDKCQVFFA